MNPPERASREPAARVSREGSLLQSLQRLLERTYRMDTGIVNIGRFVIGDEGYRLLYAEPADAALRCAGQRIVGLGARAATQGPASASAGARVLVRDGPGPVAARIYYPDALIRDLEQRPPSRGLGEENIDAFATFVEELDHFLLIAERARLRRSVSLLELELHANVTKYLVCALFLAARARAESGAGPGRSRNTLDPGIRLWLLWHLFEKIEFAEPNPQVQTRYRDAARFARRFLQRLDAETSPSGRLARLRVFHDSTHQKKLADLA